MKIKFIKGLSILALGIIALVGCKKQTETVSSNNDQYYEVAAITNDVDVAYNSAEISGGTETEQFAAVNDGLPEPYTLEEVDMDNAGYKRGIEKRFFTCLKKLSLSDEQVAKLRLKLRAYEECKAADIKKHREAVAALNERTENSRKELLAQLKNGKITKAQFEAKMKELRTKYENSLKEIKASYAKTLRACYERFIGAVKEILTEKQWRAFIDCYR